MPHAIKRLISTTAVVVIFTLPISSYAQTGATASGQASIAQILDEIKTKVQTFLDAFKDYYGISLAGDYSAPTSFASPDLNTIKENITKLNTLGTGPVNPRGEKLTELNLLDLLTSPPDNRLCTNCESQFGIESVTAMKKNLIDQGDFPHPYLLTGDQGLYANISGTRVKKLREDFQNNQLKTNQAFDFDTLLAPLFYSTQATQQKPSDLEMAKRYIQFSSGLANPIRIKNSLDPVDEQKLKDTGVNPRDDYLISLFTYISRRGVGVSNLNQFFSNRIRPDDKTPSKVELEHKMATRRMSATWHDSMETASPLTVQREMLYLLAEMNYQLYQTRLQNERLLATVSVFQLQSLDLGKGSVR